MTDFSLYYALGSTLNNILTFDVLGLLAPFQDAYNPYSVEVEAQDGLTYGHGLATTAFHWGFISQSDRDLLKTYCPGKSAIVYLRLRNANWDWNYVKAIMIWQAENPPIKGFIVDFQIAFRIIENYGENLP